MNQQLANKTKSIRELGQVDISKLKDWVGKLSEAVWLKETRTRENDFACFHHTQHIIFRFPDDLRDRTIVHDNPIWKIWKPVLKPILTKAVEAYGYQKGHIKQVAQSRLKSLQKSTLLLQLLLKDAVPLLLQKLKVPLE